jgi:ABC-type transport system substrate-binding protein
VATGRPRRGGTLVFALEAESNGWDPINGFILPVGINVARAIYDPLGAIAADGTVRPYLAQAITSSADFTRWTITLRPNIVFHDGIPCDAQAVKENFDARLASPTSRLGLAPVERVDVGDPLTVVVSMRTPWVAFPSAIGGMYQGGYIVSPRTISDGSAARHPVGTGPFVFKEWIPEDHFTATRNQGYWRAGLPYLDEIIFRPITDPTSRENSLRSGSIQLMQGADIPQTLARLRTESGVVTIDDLRTTLEPAMDFCALNTEVSPTNDLRVRQALAYAIDQQKYVNVINAGLGSVADGPFRPGSPYDGPTGYGGYDLARAKALVAAYQREKGRLSLTYTTTTSVNPEASQLLQAMWREAGIDVTIATLDQGTFGIDTLEGKYQAAAYSTLAADDPDHNYYIWSSTTAYPVGQIAPNFARNRDPDIDQALDRGRTDGDPRARAAAYQEVARRLAADLPYLWLSQGLSMVAADTSVANFAAPTLPDGRGAMPLMEGEIWTPQIWLGA